jgi:hypothetical protein
VSSIGSTKYKPCPPNQIRYYKTSRTPNGSNRCRNIDSIKKDSFVSKYLDYLMALNSNESASEIPVPIASPIASSYIASPIASGIASTHLSAPNRSRKPCPPHQIRYYKSPVTPNGTNRCRNIDTIKKDPLISKHYNYLDSLYKQELGLSNLPLEQTYSDVLSETSPLVPNSNLLEYYSILGVPSNSTPTQIQQAYAKLVLEWNPDTNELEQAPIMFTRITNAYKQLRKHHTGEFYGGSRPRQNKSSRKLSIKKSSKHQNRKLSTRRK